MDHGDAKPTALAQKRDEMLLHANCDLFRVRDVRGIAATCGGWGVCPVTSANGRPVLTGVVRCAPVVRGPDVAPMWPPAVRPSDPSLPFVPSLASTAAAQVSVSRVTVNDRRTPPETDPYGTQMARRGLGW